MMDNFDLLPNLPPFLQAKIVTKMRRASFFRLPHTGKWGLAAYEGSKRRVQHETSLQQEQHQRRLLEQISTQVEEMRNMINSVHERVSNLADHFGNMQDTFENHVDPLVNSIDQ